MNIFILMATCARRLFLPAARFGQGLATLLLLALAIAPARAQAPAWQMALAAGGNQSYCDATTADAAGNVYLTGQFSGTASFGSITLTSSGSYDAFVAKWSPATGGFVWAVRAGGAGSTAAIGIAVSGTSVYIAGSFIGATGTFGSTVLTNADGTGRTNDGYVAKLVDTGLGANFVWAQRFGGVMDDYGNSVAVNGNSLYLTGDFSGTATGFGSVALSSAGLSDGFLVKLIDAGASASAVWAQRMGGTRNDYVSSVVVRGTEVFLAGDFTGNTATFGSLTLTNTQLGAQTVFVAKLTDSGTATTFTWAQSAGGSGSNYAGQLVVSGANLYVTGSFGGSTVNFGSTTLLNAGPNGKYDGFVAKLVNAGSSAAFAWAKSLGGTGNDVAHKLAVRGTSIYVGGDFEGTATFGGFALSSIGVRDVFVAKLMDTGSSATFEWAQRAGGTDYNIGTGLELVGTTVYVGATISTPAVFGSFVLPGNGNSVACLASLTDPTLTATAGPRTLAGLELYPTPAHGAATVQVPAGTGAARVAFVLTDALGRVVREEAVALPAAGLRHALGLAGLAPGLYALRVTAGEYTATRRLVVE